jgi:hypothetical protein
MNLKEKIAMRIILTLIFVATMSLTAIAQNVQGTELPNQPCSQKYSYAYILVEGKAFSKKLKVDVDFGDTPEQIKAGKEYSEILTNKKSYAAILNYMDERHYDLVETRDYMFTYQGTGETSGIIFIMRKRNN